MFKNLSIAKRLGMGFSVTVTLGVVIVGYAAFSMQGLASSVEELASNRMVKAAQFNQLKDNFQTIGRSVRNIVIDNDPASVSDEKKKIADLRAKNSELLAKLDKTIVLPKGRAFYRTITEGRGPYNAALDHVIELAVNGDKAAAGAYLIREVLPLQNVVFKATDDSSEYQQDLADSLAKSSKETASFTVLLLSALACLMAGFGTAFGWLMARSITVPVAQAVQAADAIGRGDLSHSIPEGHGDEIGQLLRTLRSTQAGLTGVVTNVRANSESVASASSQIAQGNNDLSQRTEEQAGALQQTAATMEQLNTTVGNTADSARHANQLAKGASAVAAQGGEVVGQVVSTMEGISESSRRIGDIIGVIDGIAFQTNILALNAAVEAARAGEQGRGFAVVAAEVRSLAQRSAEAAKEIKTLIERSVEQVEKGTALVDHAGKTMGEIVGSIQRVTDIVAEITSATDEQSSGISQVGDAVSQMDQVTQQNAALVEESAAAAESLREQAQQLVQAVAVFKLPNTGVGAATPIASATNVDKKALRG